MTVGEVEHEIPGGGIALSGETLKLRHSFRDIKNCPKWTKILSGYGETAELLERFES